MIVGILRNMIPINLKSIIYPVDNENDKFLYI